MATKLMRSLRYCMHAPLYNFEMLGLVGRRGREEWGRRDLQNNPVLASSNKINGWLEEQLSAFN